MPNETKETVEFVVEIEVSEGRWFRASPIFPSLKSAQYCCFDYETRDKLKTRIIKRSIKEEVIE